MSYYIKDSSLLKKILVADTFLGGSTAILGLILLPLLSQLTALSETLLLTTFVITLIYAIVAFKLTIQKPVSIPLLRTLVYANWLWTCVCIVLFIVHYSQASLLGLIFLMLQIVVVGLLAFWEGAQIIKH